MDGWSLSNWQGTKNMVAFLHSHLKHAQTRIVRHTPLSSTDTYQPLNSPGFPDLSQRGCVPVASAALLLRTLILDLETVLRSFSH